MKQVVEKRNFETFGTDKLEESSFKVKQSREMFKLLSSNIYSDKVSAIIRELSANAIDAHVAADKKDVPIETHLPNSFEPFFYVKDFGTGLSKENIVNLYTTYGESTKTEDNSATGCFGIGSKSPFAYTDQFTITSRYNGTKYVYNCFVNDAGIPTVAAISEKETNEENGLEIYFAVEASDFREFENKAREIYKYYLVQPKVVGVPNFNIEPPNVTMEITTDNGVKVHILEDEHWELAKAVQGACSYPINVRELSTEYNRGDLDVYSNNMLIEFPLGSLNITASREHLEYDKHTQKVLKETATEIVTKLAKEVERKFKEDVKTPWQATKEAHSLSKNLPMFQQLASKVIWKSKSLNDWISEDYILDLRDDVTRKVMDPADKTKTIDKKVKRSFADMRYISSYMMRSYKNIRSDSLQGVAGLSPLHGKTIIVVLEEGVKKFNHILQYNFKENVSDEHANFQNIYFIKPDEGCYKKVMQRVNAFKNREGVTIIKFADLKEPPKAEKTKKVRKKVLTLDTKGYSWSNDDCWEGVDIDLDDGGLYVPITRFVPDGFERASHFKDMVNKLIKEEIIDKDIVVYGIPASYKTIPDNYDGWKNFFEHVDTLMDKKAKGKDIKKLYSIKYQQQILRQFNNKVLLIKTYKECAKDLEKCFEHIEKVNAIDISDDLKFVELHKDWKETRRKHQTPSNKTRDVTTDDVETKTPPTPFEKMLTNLKEKYRLLFEYSPPKGDYRFKTETFEMFKEYIELKNKS